MSAQYNPGALPPPPPIPSTQHPTPISPSTPSTPGSATSRRIQALQPPSIHTTFPPQVQSSSQTPASAFPRASPYVVNAFQPLSAGPNQVASPMSTRSPATFAAAPYNPQEWNSRNGPLGRGYVPHASPSAASAPRAATGYETSLPSPPPPYTASAIDSVSSSSSTSQYPQRGLQASLSLQHRSVTPSSATSTPASGQAPPSSFPPPPPAGQRDRSTSRSRFNLSMLTSRNRQQAISPSTPASAMETLQHQTREALARAPLPQPAAYNSAPYVPTMSPPASRRSTSTGYINSTSEPIRRSTTTTPVGEPGQDTAFNFPPPPPGPPPSSSRSRSLNRSTTPEQSALRPSAPTRRPMHASNLGPIPPTPADWADGGMQSRSEAPELPGPPPRDISQSRLDTHGQVGHGSMSRSRSREEEDHALSEQARMNIRERRNASKARSQSRGPGETIAGEIAKPADLVLQSPNGALSRKRVVKSKTSPLMNSHRSPLSSARDLQPDTPHWPASAPVEGSDFTPPVTGGGPRDAIENKQRTASGRADVFTPITPAEALASARSLGSMRLTSPLIGEPSSRSSYGNSNRPSSSASNLSLGAMNDKNSFASGAQDRHLRFLEQEAAATSDVERLELFAAFVVNESRMRRDRYSEAFESMGSDVLDLTRDMWRSQKAPKRKQTTKPDTASSPQPVTIESSSHEAAPSSASSGSFATGYSPSTEPESPNQGRSRSQARRAESFQPMLSPIPSMAMSTVRDPEEQDSRGRAPSRWWEASSQGGSVGNGRQIERSKRESKYMGVSRETLQWGIPEHDSPGPSQQFHAYGPNEYPPEKAGWHDAQESLPGTPYLPKTPKTPRNEDTYKMDVSRLVTLPPPYPRHHPAVNNNHPHLADIRATLRQVTDEDQTSSTREAYESARAVESPEQSSTEGLDQRRMEMRARIRSKVASGEISFAEAATAEADFEQSETARAQESAQRSFDLFQKKVHKPLSTHYADQINKATNSIEQLRSSLADDARSHDPNQAQEEGDEQPELLEKITLLKWFFEAREQLFRRMLELDQESDDMYRSVIITPYRASKNEEKIHEVESFFRKDSLDRRVKQQNKSHARFEDFLKTVDKHSTRGLQLQNEAFWDIAPSLLEIVQKVPSNLRGFNVMIPPAEYQETPSYHDFPLQYLYSLLNHANKSAYQFIESQVNLSCLLHEVKTSVMKANCKQLSLQRQLAGETSMNVDDEMMALQTHEEESITRDLKEKVNFIEEQWRQALGNGVKDCMRRVEQHLVSQGGWDESLVE